MESLLKNYRAGKENSRISGWYTGWISRCAGDGFAKTKEAAADLSRQVQTKMADKFYYAVTDGVPEQKKGTLEDYLLRDGKTNTSKVVSKSTEGAKSARLDYEVTAQNKTNAILRIRLDTGRHHQIRVQLANAGIPIVGDTKYNFKETMTRSETVFYSALIKSDLNIQRHIKKWSSKSGIHFSSETETQELQITSMFLL